MYARLYAQIIGVVLVLVGVVGLVLGNVVWLGILNVDIVEDIVHLITGGLLAYVGFGRTDLVLTRTVVGVLGIIYLEAVMNLLRNGLRMRKTGDRR